MKKAEKEAIVASGRAHLRAWMESAEKHGTIYYNIPHVARSGMSRNIELATIIMRDGQPELVRLWPKCDESLLGRGTADYSAALDVIAKDWGFNFDKRCFVIGGCGMDMVFALVDNLAHKAGLNDYAPRADEGTSQPGHKEYRARSYANRVRRESF